MTRTRTALITGFPKTELARWVLGTWLANDLDARAVCVVPRQFSDVAARRVLELSPDQRARVRLIEGDAAFMDLGLSGALLREVTSRLDVIHHCAAMDYSGVDPQRATAFNTEATREAVELALASPQLERLVLWSTTRAVGSVDGLVLEDASAPPHRGPIAASRHLAEGIVRELAHRLPVTVLRTSNLVGDSRTGYWPRMEGVYLIARTLLLSSRDVVLPMPARRDGLLNVVPVDYAARAGCLLADHRASRGRTFHIVDPGPPTVAAVFKLFAHLTGRPEPRQGLPGPLAEAILRTPGISRVAHGPRDLLDELGRRARYDDRNARELLDAASLRCPPLADYAPLIVEFIRSLPPDSTWPDPLKPKEEGLEPEPGEPRPAT